MTDSPHIDAALVRRLLAEQFPHWSDLELRPVDSPGMDNRTYRLGEALSVRLPRFRRWAGQVEREQYWLPRLAPRLPVAVSQPLARGVPGAGYPFDWSVYRWLDGEPLDPGRLPEQRGFARDLAGFIAALWELDPAGGPEPQWSNAFRGVPLDAPVDSIAARERVLPKLAELRGRADIDALWAVWEDALAAPAWDGPPRWLHGDMFPGNLLAVGGRLSAVIDFGTLAVGDPAADVVSAWMFTDPRARAVLRSELSVDDATWARARGWALAGALPVPSDPFFADRPDRVETALRRLDALVADLRAG